MSQDGELADFSDTVERIVDILDHVLYALYLLGGASYGATREGYERYWAHEEGKCREEKPVILLGGLAPDFTWGVELEEGEDE